MAGQVSGVDIKVAVYDENVTYGVAPLTPFGGRYLYFSKLGLSADQGLVESPVLSAGRGTRRPGVGNIAVAGSIETTIAPESIGFFLKHLLGTPTTSGSGPYTHVFRPKALPIGFMVEKDYTAKIASKVERFNGLRIASADFDFQQEGFCTASFAVMGKSHSIASAVLDSSMDDYGHTGFTGFEGIVKQGGSQIGGVTGFKLKVDNSMPGGPYCFPASGETAGQRLSNPEGRAKISGSMDLVFQDFSLLDLAIAGTETTFEVTLQHGTGLGTAGNEKITFLVDHAIVPRKSPPLETEAGIILSVEFSAFASGATDMGLVVTLMNAMTGATI